MLQQGLLVAELNLPRCCIKPHLGVEASSARDLGNRGGHELEVAYSACNRLHDHALQG